MRQVLPGLACLARSMILIMAIVVIETSVLCLHADYMPVGGYCAVFSLTPAQSVISVGDSTLFYGG